MKKIAAMLAVLLYGLSNVVFAQPSVQMSVVDYPKYIVPSEMKSDLPITIVINTTLGNYTISDSKLDILVTDSRDKILYIDSRYVGLYEGSTTFTWYLPSNIVEDLLSKDGTIKVKMQLVVLFTNNEGDYIIDNDNIVELTIQVKDYIKAGDIDVLFLAPNLDNIKELDRKTYTFMLKLRNDDIDSSDVAKAEVYITIYDQFGNIVLEVPTIVRLNPGEERTVRQDINFALLKPGYYTIEVKIEDDGLILFKKDWEVVVGATSIIPIEVLSTQIIPPKYDKGDLVMARLMVKNELLREITLQPEVISEELDLYRRLTTITLEPGETKEVKVVIPIPEDITGGEKTVTVRFWYGPSVYSTEIKLYIPEEKQIQEEKILSLDVPSEVEVTEEGAEIVASITTYVEDLIPVRLELSTQNVDATLEKTTLLVGGYGLSRDVTIKINKVYGDLGKVTLKVYDTEGNLLAMKSIDVIPEVKEKEKEETLSPTQEIYNENVKYLLIAVIAIIIAAVLYRLYRKGEEEHPSE